MQLYRAHRTMCEALSHSRLKFTLDGRLLGDFGEYLVEQHFGMRPMDTRTKAVDGRFPDNERTIQVKVTQSEVHGPTFTPGDGTAEHLMFLWLDFAEQCAHVRYNGPEAPIRGLKVGGFKTPTRLDLRSVMELNRTVAKHDRMPRLR